MITVGSMITYLQTWLIETLKGLSRLSLPRNYMSTNWLSALITFAGQYINLEQCDSLFGSI